MISHQLKTSENTDLSVLTPEKIISKYYSENQFTLEILMTHSICVAEKALRIAQKNSHLNINKELLWEMAMLHDIGIFMTHAPELGCSGTLPYICHGYIGREMLEKENLPLHALACERHTGAGLSLDEIKQQQLPIPHRNMIPVSIEEQIICFADKFFSKSGNLTKEKSISEIKKQMLPFGKEQTERFNKWCAVFL
jgi:uncharacterized protein